MNPLSKYVTDCICHRKKIDDIVRDAKAQNLCTMKSVCVTLKCGLKCAKCRPFIAERLGIEYIPPPSRGARQTASRISAKDSNSVRL